MHPIPYHSFPSRLLFPPPKPQHFFFCSISTIKWSDHDEPTKRNGDGLPAKPTGWGNYVVTKRARLDQSEAARTDKTLKAQRRNPNCQAQHVNHLEPAGGMEPCWDEEKP